MPQFVVPEVGPAVGIAVIPFGEVFGMNLMSLDCPTPRLGGVPQ